jgi:hypothetical protein
MRRHVNRAAPTPLVIAAFLSVYAVPAVACEPLPPLLVLFAVPSLMTGAVMGILGLGVGFIVGLGIKCGAFAFFEPTLPRGKALWAMFRANLVTTCVGIFATIALTVPPLLLLSPLLYGLMCYPVQRLTRQMSWRWLGPKMLSLLGLLLFLASYVLFFLARAQTAPGGSLALYWVLKLAYLYPALIVSLGLTTLWEEWLVSQWVLGPEAQTSCYASVLRANLVMLVLLVGLAAIAAVPKRLAAPDFLF